MSLPISAYQTAQKSIDALRDGPPTELPSIGGGLGGISGADKDKGPNFAEALTGAMSKAGEAERTADDNAARFAAGDPQMGIHEVMIGAEKASIAVRYAVTLKNHVIEAYRDLMNTPL